MKRITQLLDTDDGRFCLEVSFPKISLPPLSMRQMSDKGVPCQSLRWGSAPVITSEFFDNQDYVGARKWLDLVTAYVRNLDVSYMGLRKELANILGDAEV